MCPAKAGVEGESTIGGQKNDEKAEQADQIERVQIAALFEEKHVDETDREQGGGDTIEEAENDEDGHQTQSDEEIVHSISGQRREPSEPGVGKMILRLDPVSIDSVLLKIAPDFPEHDQAENDPDIDQSGNVDGALDG